MNNSLKKAIQDEENAVAVEDLKNCCWLILKRQKNN